MRTKKEIMDEFSKSRNLVSERIVSLEVQIDIRDQLALIAKHLAPITINVPSPANATSAPVVDLKNEIKKGE